MAAFCGHQPSRYGRVTRIFQSAGVLRAHPASDAWSRLNASMSMMCPVCATEVPDYYYEHPNGARVKCSMCGTYRLMERAGQLLGERRSYNQDHAVVPNRRLSATLRQQA